MIGDQVADRDVDFVTDGRDDRNTASREGARDAFVVEGREILARSTAASDDHEIRATPPIHPVECAAELVSSRVALNRGRH